MMFIFFDLVVIKTSIFMDRYLLASKELLLLPPFLLLLLPPLLLPPLALLLFLTLRPEFSISPLLLELREETTPSDLGKSIHLILTFC